MTLPVNASNYYKVQGEDIIGVFNDFFRSYLAIAWELAAERR